MKYMEDMAVAAIANYATAGTPLNWTLTRERDIESVEVIFCMGAITKGAADSTADPFWGLLFFQMTYDDKKIRLPGWQLAAYNFFFYPDDVARVGAMAWADATAAGQAAMEWYARCRLAVHCPQKAGAFLQCSAIQSGEAFWTQAAANNLLAAGNIFVFPRYGSFDYRLSADFVENLNIAGATTVLPGVTGTLYVGSIIGLYVTIGAFIDGVALTSSNIYGPNTYNGANVTSLTVDVAGDTLINLPNAPTAEWALAKASLQKVQNHAAAVATPVEAAFGVNLCELLIDGGVLFPSGSAVRYVVNGTAGVDLYTTTIFGDPIDREHTGGVPVGNEQSGPGGTKTAPPTTTSKAISPGGNRPLLRTRRFGGSR